MYFVTSFCISFLCKNHIVKSSSPWLYFYNLLAFLAILTILFLNLTSSISYYPTFCLYLTNKPFLCFSSSLHEITYSFGAIFYFHTLLSCTLPSPIILLFIFVIRVNRFYVYHLFILCHYLFFMFHFLLPCIIDSLFETISLPSSIIPLLILFIKHFYVYHCFISLFYVIIY